ncbi:aromatic ring-hydroxylating dioxygenase subunit alpha [Microtetraspora sp. NBRC 16547]|uniref:aromatic ring-hydroxylating oxygenase subunit alpha n=1 Tax=Microtetraspora sp. NBRC 16547 TaxID=3030993 RepID=UPI0024A1C07F|nr:aromatic ring-hydroxylating dioxygenase subunit alpha [Microtetraspora sp. NBRC 16547]GLW97145.1 aromatic-ring-hydroxylating dioxygenase subunit alpha [Microtetraspora sp. NBRC 16547]
MTQLTHTDLTHTGPGGPPNHSLVQEDWEALTFKVHRSAYRSPAVFQKETSRIWGHTWLYLGHETEIPNPGDFKSRTLGGRPLIFCRDSSGQVQVFFNACTHRGTILCRHSEGNTKFFQCFYHAWAFSNSGELAALPGDDAYTDVPGFKERHRLRSVPRVDSHEGFVFISFDPDVPDLMTHLGEAAHYMSLTAKIGPQGMQTVPGVQLYSVKGNWKLAVENAMDGYHFAPTHNTFVGYLRETGFAVTDDDQYAYDLGDGHGLLILTGHNGRIGMVWEPRFGEAEKERTAAKRQEMEQRLGKELAAEIADASRILFVFPNLLLFDLEALTIRQLEPVEAGRTDVRAWQFVETGEPDDVRALRIKTMVSFVGPGGLATPDDIEAYEAVQRGIEATADSADPAYDWSDMSRGMANEKQGNQGRSIDEGAMRSFWRQWSRRVEDGTPGA